jgi:hypothetical protein
MVGEALENTVAKGLGKFKILTKQEGAIRRLGKDSWALISFITD